MTAPFPSRPSEVREWCISRGFHPSRPLGQNFLVDGNTIEFIARAAGSAPGARILEIGPGLGAITRPMLAAGLRVTAVEKDSRLAALLAESCAGFGDAFELIEADALMLDLDSLLSRRFDAFVSNLPYSVGTRILIELCRSRLAPPRLVAMVQKEVADRLAAGPGSPERGQAGVWVQARWKVGALKTVPPSCFWPRPEISSTIVELLLDDRLPEPIERRFYSVSKIAFTQRRKQLATILKNNAAALGIQPGAQAAVLEAASIDPAARPETLSHDDWLRLAAALPDRAGENARRRGANVEDPKGA